MNKEKVCLLLCDETSMWREVLWRDVLGQNVNGTKFPCDETSRNKMSCDELSCDETSGSRNSWPCCAPLCQCACRNQTNATRNLKNNATNERIPGEWGNELVFFFICCKIVINEETNLLGCWFVARLWWGCEREVCCDFAGESFLLWYVWSAGGATVYILAKNLKFFPPSTILGRPGFPVFAAIFLAKFRACDLQIDE